MTTAHHDYAVQLLTDTQRFVRLVVQREIRGPLEPPQSPRSPSLLKGLSPSGYMANRPGNYIYLFVRVCICFNKSHFQLIQVIDVQLVI